MAVYDELGQAAGIAFYTSPDLKHGSSGAASRASSSAPTFSELPVDGQAREKALGADRRQQRIHGGRHSTANASRPKRRKLPGHRGNAFYAAQTFSDIPSAGRPAHPDRLGSHGHTRHALQPDDVFSVRTHASCDQRRSATGVAADPRNSGTLGPGPHLAERGADTRSKSAGRRGRRIIRCSSGTSDG